MCCVPCRLGWSYTDRTTGPSPAFLLLCFGQVNAEGSQVNALLCSAQRLALGPHITSTAWDLPLHCFLHHDTVCCTFSFAFECPAQLHRPTPTEWGATAALTQAGLGVGGGCWLVSRSHTNCGMWAFPPHRARLPPLLYCVPCRLGLELHSLISTHSTTACLASPL